MSRSEGIGGALVPASLGDAVVGGFPATDLIRHRHRKGDIEWYQEPDNLPFAFCRAAP